MNVSCRDKNGLEFAAFDLRINDLPPPCASRYGL